MAAIFQGKSFILIAATKRVGLIPVLGLTTTHKRLMDQKNRKYTLVALVPMFMTPLAIILGKRNQSDFFLGLSSNFWAGTLLAVSISAGVLAIVLLVRARQPTR